MSRFKRSPKEKRLEAIKLLLDTKGEEALFYLSGTELKEFKKEIEEYGNIKYNIPGS